MTSTEAIIYQLKQLKGKPFKQKAEHIITYFWLPILLALVLLGSIVSYIVHITTQKDVALNILCLNTLAEQETAEAYLAEFSEAAGIDLEKYEMHISTDLLLDDTDLSGSYDIAQLLAAQIAAQSLDVIVADLETATYCFYQEYYENLDQVLTPQQLEQYAEFLLYVDMAVVRQLRSELAVTLPIFPDPTKPEAMAEPVAVALRIPQDSAFKDTCYPYMETDIGIGLVVNSQNLSNALAFLKYIME